MNDKIDTIVAGVNRKDEKMWGDFYDRFYAALCVYVSKILPVPDAVEDLVQEVLFLYGRGNVLFLVLKSLPIIFIVPAIITPYYIYAIIKSMIPY